MLQLYQVDTRARQAADQETQARAEQLQRVELEGAEVEQRVEQAEATATAADEVRRTPQGWTDGHRTDRQTDRQADIRWRRG